MSQQDKGKQSNKYPTTALKTKEPIKHENILLKRERKATRLVLSQVE
jgi:hypothetical protein